jgi:hypothetical protein
MSVELLEPIIHSGFFLLKHSFTIAEQKKHHLNSDLQGISSKKITSDRDDMVTSRQLDTLFRCVCVLNTNTNHKKKCV